MFPFFPLYKAEFPSEREHITTGQNNKMELAIHTALWHTFFLSRKVIYCVPKACNSFICVFDPHQLLFSLLNCVKVSIDYRLTVRLTEDRA